MSLDFAAKVMQSAASFAVHKAQLRATEAWLAEITIKRTRAIRLTGLADNRRNIFHIMDLPEEVRRIILEMVVQETVDNVNLCDIPHALPAIAAAGNEQLRQETILAILENMTVSASWRPELQESWLSTVNFGVLQQAGISPIQDGFSAIRVTKMRICEYGLQTNNGPLRLVKRFANLRELTVESTAGVEMFRLGFDNISGDAVGARVRECNLDLPSLELSNLRRLKVTLRINSLCYDHWRNEIACFPEWKSIIEHGCKKLAQWLSDEYDARGMRVTVEIQADLDM
jgi:hypothetical protein